MQQLVKRFGTREVLRDLTLEVQRGEFLVLAGPSGCGKTTTLRLIAGLEWPTSGQLEIGGEEVSRTPPWNRRVAMVFQSQALYPHLTVADNLRFGLRRLRWTRKAQHDRVAEIADLLAIRRLLPRRVWELSGGERQRVAVGRAIARPADIYLLDEPLGSLDPPLREQLRLELTELQRALEATFLYVTHDPHEAITMGDRLALLDEGELQQLGPPLELYHRPVNRFVAEFLGTPRMNLSLAELLRKDRQWALKIGGTLHELPASLAENCSTATAIATATETETPGGARVLWGARPEDWQHVADDPSPSSRESSPFPPWRLEGQVIRVQHLGSQIQITVAIGTDRLHLLRPTTDRSPQVGDLLPLQVDPRRLYLFDPRTGQAFGTRAGDRAGGVRPN